MKKKLKIGTPNIILSLFILTLLGMPREAEEIPKARGEIRIVESWRPDITVLGHNVLQYLFEYAFNKNELAPSLGVSREWVDDTTLEIKLRQDVHFANGEPFDAHAVKFNFDYQREHNPGRGVQVYMKNLKEVQTIDPYTETTIGRHPIAHCTQIILIHRVAFLISYHICPAHLGKTSLLFHWIVELRKRVA